MSLDAGGGRERRLCGVLAEKVWPEYIYEETGDRGGDQTVKCIFFWSLWTYLSPVQDYLNFCFPQGF